MTRKRITQAQWEKMSPAEQTMWTMQQGAEPPTPKDQPTTKRADRMQEATEDYQDAMERYNNRT